MEKTAITARNILLFAVILALALCAGCSGNPSESSGAAQSPAATEPVPSSAEAIPSAQVNPLDAAFSAGETIRLAPADLSGSPGEDYMPVGISPDGETVLWRNKEGLAVTRNSEMLPVVFNAERGAGDPYQVAKFISSLLKGMPYWEGFSWSADGRYVALSAMETADRNISFGTAVLDTSSGETYLTKAYNKDLQEDSSGLVYLTRIDRAGHYLYYLVSEHEKDENRLRFCRCPVEGGDREILCDMSSKDRAFVFDAHSALYEAQDGNWVLNGITGLGRESYEQYALIRFSPSGDGWTWEVIPTGVPAFGEAVGSVSCFSQSGYGLFCLLNTRGNAQNMINNSTSSEESAALLRASVRPAFFNRIGLLRILPGPEVQHDVWSLVRTDDGNGRQLVPADDLLWMIKKQYNEIDPSEEAASIIWLAEHYDSLEDLYNRYFSEEARNKDARGEEVVIIRLACMSPDGRYALINAGSREFGFELYMLSLDTMQILPVEAPEGIPGMELTISPFAQEFKPCIVWNEDGTLLIQNSDTRRTAAYRLEIGSAQ